MNVLESEKWKRRFMRMAYQNAAFSKDPSTQVGAIIVEPDGTPVSNGFNGMAMGVNDSVESRWERPEKYEWLEHGERNALHFAERSIRGCIMFVTHLPCPPCANAIRQRKVGHVVVDLRHSKGLPPKPGRVQTIDKYEITTAIFREGGVKLHTVDSDVELKMIDGEWFVLPRKDIYEYEA